MEGDGGLLGQIGQRLWQREFGEGAGCKWMQIGFQSGGGVQGLHMS